MREKHAMPFSSLDILGQRRRRLGRELGNDPGGRKPICATRWASTYAMLGGNRRKGKRNCSLG